MSPLWPLAVLAAGSVRTGCLVTGWGIAGIGWREDERAKTRREDEGR
jgi:hypothetical protein